MTDQPKDAALPPIDWGPHSRHRGVFRDCREPECVAERAATPAPAPDLAALREALTAVLHDALRAAWKSHSGFTAKSDTEYHRQQADLIVSLATPYLGVTVGRTDCDHGEVQLHPHGRVYCAKCRRWGGIDAATPAPAPDLAGLREAALEFIEAFDAAPGSMWVETFRRLHMGEAVRLRNRSRAAPSGVTAGPDVPDGEWFSVGGRGPFRITFKGDPMVLDCFLVEAYDGADGPMVEYVPRETER